MEKVFYLLALLVRPFSPLLKRGLRGIFISTLCPLLYALFCFLPGCAYVLDSMISAPAPRVVHEICREQGRTTSCNWWTGDGLSHWCYCSEIQEGKTRRTICSGDCR